MNRTGNILHVAGCGPAGIMACLAAAREGVAVKIVDPHNPPAAKILASGGGRCNLTNTVSAPAFMERFGRQGRFTSDALSAFAPNDLRRLLDRMGVRTEADASGRVFPSSGGASTVHSILLRAVGEVGTTPERHRLDEVIASDGAVSAIRTGGRLIPARAVVIATGGCGYPALGADGSGFAIAAALGIRVTPTFPALVPLTCADPLIRSLAGVSLPRAGVRLPVRGRGALCATGDILFTHRGLSGPAILDISGEVSCRLAAGGAVDIHVSANPAMTVGDWIARADEWRRSCARKRVISVLDGILPVSFAAAVLRIAGVGPETRISQCNNESWRRISGLLAAFPVTVNGTEGFDRAMVTRGGVALAEIDPRTLQSRRIRGLYFAGEMVDIDGPTGGFNLQWAFSSGWLAGQSAARQLIGEE